MLSCLIVAFYCEVRVVELLLLSENKDTTGEIVSILLFSCVALLYGEMNTCFGTDSDGSLVVLSNNAKSSMERVVSLSSIAFGLLVCRFPSIISCEPNAGTFLMGGYGGGLIDLHMSTMKLSLICHFKFILFHPKQAN